MPGFRVCPHTETLHPIFGLFILFSRVICSLFCFFSGFETINDLLNSFLGFLCTLYYEIEEIYNDVTDHI